MPDDVSHRPADRATPVASRRDASRRRHDVINLLMVIDLACDSLLQQIGPDDPLREDVEQIAEARRQLLAYADEGPI